VENDFQSRRKNQISAAIFAAQFAFAIGRKRQKKKLQPSTSLPLIASQDQRQVFLAAHMHLPRQLSLFLGER
jgi:hypothetical protein